MGGRGRGVVSRFTARCLDSVSWIALLKRMPEFTHSNYGAIIYQAAQLIGVAVR